jgi:RHS repeat-associated protein
LGGVTTSTYNDQGKVISQAVASGTSGAPSVVTTTTYDSAGRTTKTTTGTDTTRSYYDPTGSLYCSITAVAYAAGHRCPSWSHTWLTLPPSPSTAPVGVSFTITNADGSTVQQSTPDQGATVTAYDKTSRPYCSVTADDLASWLTTHHGASYPYLCPTTAPTTPPTGHKYGYTTTIYTPGGKVAATTSPTGVTTATSYDTAGLKETVTKGGATTTYCHYADTCASGAPNNGGTGTDVYSTTQPPTSADPTGEVTTSTYNPTGNVAKTVTPAVTTTYGYDGAGNVTSITYSSVASGYTAPHNVSETYNATGTRASMTDGTGTTSYTYDKAGDLTATSFSPATGSGLTTQAIAYGYYPTGQQKSITYPSYGSVSNPTATYTYSSNGNMATVGDWLGHTTTFGYNDNNDLNATTYPNSTTASNSLDTTGQLTKVELAPSAHLTSPVATMAYTRNATEQVTKETDTGDLATTVAYSYDPSERLSSAGSHTTTYGTNTAPSTLPNGAGATYDLAGELTKSTHGSTTTTYTNDSIGARTKAVSSTPSSTTTYAYDALGQLRSATVGGSTASFKYNGDGVRLGKTIGSSTQTYVWNTTSGTPQVLSDGTTDFLYGPSGEVLEQISTSSTAPTYLVHDQVGSTRLLTNQTGTVVGTYSYDAYGRLSNHTGSTSPIGYAGGWETTADKLVYLVHRYYDPSTGSFLSVDPTVATTTSPYTYAEDDPINRSDPGGNATVGICGSAGAQIGFLSLAANVCLTRTIDQSGEDDIGLVGTGAVGVGAGADLSVGLYYEVSNATNLRELASWFNFATFGVGVIEGGSVTVFWNSSDTIRGIAVGISLQGGVDVAVGKSWSKVDQFTTSIEANIARGIWDAANPGLAITALLDKATKDVKKAMTRHTTSCR